MPPAQPARLKHAAASFLADFNSLTVKLTGIACLTVLLIAGAAAYFVSRHNAATAQNTAQNTDKPNPSPSAEAPLPSGSIAKPSPIGRAQPPAPVPAAAPRIVAPARPAPQRNYAALAPLPAARPAAPTAAPVLTPAFAPVSAPSLPFGVRMSANRDGFNNGCKHGALVMELATVRFTCPSDPSKSVAVKAGQVLELDNNGVIVFPRQKYHFDIAGKQKQDVHQLFAQWLENARRTASARASN